MKKSLTKLKNLLSEESRKLRRYFENIKNAKPEVGECEKILGDSTKVGDFGYFWKNQAADIQMVSAVKLMEYEANNNFTKEEISAFKLGLATIPIFLEECQKEVLSRRKNMLANKDS